MESVAFGFMEGEKHNEMRESFCVLQSRFEFFEYLQFSLDRIEAVGLCVFLGIDVLFLFKGSMDDPDGLEPEEDALILFGQEIFFCDLSQPLKQTFLVS